MCSRRKSGEDAAFETRRLRDENRRRNAPRSRLKTLARSSTKSKITNTELGALSRATLASRAATTRSFRRALKQRHHRQLNKTFRRALKQRHHRQLNKTTPTAQ